MKKVKRQLGFTLVEILLYLGIFSLLLVVLLQFFSSIVDVGIESEATSAVTQNGKYLLSRFSYDIQGATSIVIPASAGAQASSLQIVTSGQTYTYSLANGNVTITTPGGTDVLNSADAKVQSLLFTRYGNKSVSISFILTSIALRRGGAETAPFQTTMTMRN